MNFSKIAIVLTVLRDCQILWTLGDRSRCMFEHVSSLTTELLHRRERIQLSGRSNRSVLTELLLQLWQKAATWLHGSRVIQCKQKRTRITRSIYTSMSELATTLLVTPNANSISFRFALGLLFALASSLPRQLLSSSRRC